MTRCKPLEAAIWCIILIVITEMHLTIKLIMSYQRNIDIANTFSQTDVTLDLENHN